MPRMNTGFPDADATDDFRRVRRQQAMARLARRAKPLQSYGGPPGQRRALGLQTISLDSIVGTMDRERDFDGRFRPTSNRARDRWQRIARAYRRGEELPPISVYRVGDSHYVRDGHHRVSVARALGRTQLDAYVTELG